MFLSENFCMSVVFLSSGELCRNYTCGMKLLKCPFATNIGDGQGYLPVGASFLSPSLHGLEVGVGYGSYLGLRPSISDFSLYPSTIYGFKV